MEIVITLIGIVVGAVIGWDWNHFNMVVGKGKFIGVNFDENTVIFKYKFWKLGEIADNVLGKISDEVTKDNAGLAQTDVIMNDGEIIISLMYDKEKLREMEKEDPQHFINPGETPFYFDFERQEPLLSRICKNCL